MGSTRQAASRDSLGKSDTPKSSYVKSSYVAESDALERHLPDLRRRARVLMRRNTDAEDLAQDCMLRALEHIDDIEDMRAYLFQTLRNAYADRIGQMSRDAVAFALDDARVQLVERGSPHLRLELHDLSRQVAKLSRKQQQVVLLIAGGATYDEAALHLHVPVGTVTSRLSRARKALRDSFAKDQNTLD